MNNLINSISTINAIVAFFGNVGVIIAIVVAIWHFITKKHKKRILNILREIPSFYDGYKKNYNEYEKDFSKHIDGYTNPTFKEEYFAYKDNFLNLLKRCILRKPAPPLITFADLFKRIKDKNDEQRVIIVYAEAGMGKTRFMCNLTYKLLLHASKKKRNKNENIRKGKIPLVSCGIFYTEFNKHPSIEELIEEINKVKENQDIDYLILDGLDECREYFNEESADNILKKLLEGLRDIITGIDKIIISSRANMLENKDLASQNIIIRAKEYGMKKDKIIKIIKIKMNRFNDKQIIDRCKTINKINKSEMPNDLIKKIGIHLSKARKSKKESILQVPFFISFASDIFEKIDDNALSDLSSENALKIAVDTCIEKEYENRKETKKDLDHKDYTAEMMSFFGKVAYKMYEEKRLVLTKEEHAKIYCKYPKEKERIFMIRKEEKPQDEIQEEDDMQGIFYFQHKLFFEYFLVYHFVHSIADDAVFNSLKEQIDSTITMSLRERRRLLGFYPDTESQHIYINSDFSKRLYAHFLNEFFLDKENKNEIMENNVKTFSIKGGHCTVTQSSIRELPKAENVTIVDSPIWNIDRIILLLPLIKSLNYRKFRISDYDDLVDYVDEQFLAVNKEALLDCNGADKFGKLAILDATQGKINLSELECFEEVSKEIHIVINNPDELNDLQKIKTEKIKLLVKTEAEFLPNLVQMIIDANLKQERFSFYNSIKSDFIDKVLKIIQTEEADNSFKDLLFLEGLHFIELHYSGFMNNDTFGIRHKINTIYIRNPKEFCRFTRDLYQKRSENYGANHSYTISALVWYAHNVNNKNVNDVYNAILSSDLKGVHIYLHQFVMIRLAQCQNLLGKYNEVLETLNSVYKHLSESIQSREYLFNVQIGRIRALICQEKYNETLISLCESTLQLFSDIRNYGLYEEALLNTGLAYSGIKGLDNNLEMAVKYYKEAAEQGHPVAKYSLGFCYYNGNGIEQSYEKAAEWFKEAAEQGYAEAQCILGNCYYNGNGVEQSYEKAMEWLIKAAEQGHAVAQCSLGNCYYNGNGVEQSYKKAVEWYKKAAEQGFSVAQYHLGKCYQKKLGVKMDIEQAKIWYKKAAEQGDYDAINALDSLEKR